MRGEALREQILLTGKQLLKEQSWNEMDIRSIAKASGVAVGSIYNYYGSKNVLMEALARSIWEEIFVLPEDQSCFENIIDTVAWIYERMDYGWTQYPEFLEIHSFGRALDENKELLMTWSKRCIEKIIFVFERDKNIRKDAFNEKLTKEAYAEILFGQILLSLVNHREDPRPLQELITRVLY